MVVEPAELQPCEPYLATPALEPEQRKGNRREPEPVLETIEAEAVPFAAPEPEVPSNVQPLRPYDRGLTFGARHDPSRTADASDPFKYRPRGD